jgi:DNA-binding LacI/PurR family transcriptional regulator
LEEAENAVISRTGFMLPAPSLLLQEFSLSTTGLLFTQILSVSGFNISSGGEQVAAHLRAGLLEGRWSGVMPGKNRLARELRVSGEIVVAALAQLEREGLLEGQGARRRRRITVAASGEQVRRLRVAILDYDPPEMIERYISDLRHHLESAGHAAFFAEKTLLELKLNVRRVAQMVAKAEADAWVVCAGSREVLEWFAAQPVPAFALFGRRQNVALAAAGPDHLPAGLTAVRRLLELGHRRIVMVVRQERRTGGPGNIEGAILAEMAAHGIRTGPYNLPDWEDSREGFHRLLDQIYRVTPPSALILDQAFLFFAAQQHLAQRGVLAPQQVSLVCTAPDPTFAWCQPTIAHIRFDMRQVLRRVVRWADNVGRGKDDRRQSLITAEFVDGGTVGPVRG